MAAQGRPKTTAKTANCRAYQPAFWVKWLAKSPQVTHLTPPGFTASDLSSRLSFLNSTTASTVTARPIQIAHQSSFSHNALKPKGAGWGTGSVAGVFMGRLFKGEGVVSNPARRKPPRPFDAAAATLAAAPKD